MGPILGKEEEDWERTKMKSHWSSEKTTFVPCARYY
jgi:hypothetical protein